MKKSVLLVLSLGFTLVSHPAFCADETTTAPTAVEAVTPEAADPIAEEAAPAELEETAPVLETAPAVPTDNLEFISGEISAVDPSAKTVTVKLYGETEAAATDKLLTITLEDTTDITDGEKDRDLQSLTPGTEVDVEYDPASKKATYIFVY